MVYQYGSTETSLDTPLFSLDSALLPKLITPSEYSIFDNGFTPQMALKNNFMCQGVLMGVHG
jgi:hypothetical protein